MESGAIESRRASVLPVSFTVSASTSAEWPCTSTSPGVSSRPRASRTRAAAGTSALPAGTTAAMRPPRTTTVRCDAARPVRVSSTVASRITRSAAPGGRRRTRRGGRASGGPPRGRRGAARGAWSGREANGGAGGDSPRTMTMPLQPAGGRRSNDRRPATQQVARQGHEGARRRGPPFRRGVPAPDWPRVPANAAGSRASDRGRAVQRRRRNRGWRRDAYPRRSSLTRRRADVSPKARVQRGYLSRG
jgi:hypothetical protein